MKLNPLILGYIASVLESLPLILTDSEEIVSWVAGQIATIRDMIASGDSPTADQWAALDQAISDLRAKLAAAAPPAPEPAPQEETTAGPAAAPTGAVPFPSAGANEGA